MKNRIKSDKKTGYTERILVPVSNPVHVNELMDLAFYFHSHSELAIYPLTILNKIAGDEESMGIANALLEKAAQSPVPDNVHIEPVIASDINEIGRAAGRGGGGGPEREVGVEGRVGS